MLLTPEQQSAVALRGRSVLVSAAAGAGKTRVLVERLMGYVTDPEQPRHIDDFLVVTYTRAAAGELRSRIFSRLRELLAEMPDDGHLYEQLTRVYTAKIGTLDAYCREIILENAAEAGLPSGYRAGDAAEMELLQARVLEEALDTLYERAEDDPADLFHLCADTYGDERGDRVLGNLILHIWQKTRCHADPMGWLKEKTDAFPGGDWQAILIDQALCIAESFRRDCAQMAGGPTWQKDLADMEGLIGILRGGDWDTAGSFAQSYKFERLKGENSEEFKTLRDRWKKAFNNKIQPLFSDDTDDSALSPLLAGLCDAVRVFDKALTAEKLRLSVLEFSDVQRIALNLLEDKPPARFVEILVDEYQDINPLQDAIITALSRNGGNIFYVGDTRQSIYRFQMAEPGIFQKKLETAPNRIFLTKNFRSSKNILDTVNHVFSHIDCPEMGLLQQHEFLISGNSGEADPPVELLAGETAEDEPGRVARRLRSLVENGEARAEDCVILMRSPKNRLPEYKAALEREGLACAAPSGEGYFSRPEILTILSALESIDNARLDIPLLSVLRSPIAACTPDELAALRILADGPLCGCLPLSQDPKIAAFCAIFQTWREIAADLPPYILAARVMADSGLPQKVNPAARENLLLLPEVLREFRGDLRGLPDWLRKQDRAVTGFADSTAQGGVRVLSIHASKGLEFPVVVVAGLSKRLNLQDQHARLLAHPRLGLGIKRREGFLEVPTPSYRAVQAVMDSETRAEELRLLYVAMTRAERRLILSCNALPEGEPSRMVTKGDLILHSHVASWLLKARDPRWELVAPEPDDSADDNAPGRDAPALPVRPPEPDWAYPYPEAVDTPSKMTATGLKGRYPDEQAHEDAAGWHAPSALPPTERGTATHLFLQFADFAKCAAPGGAEAERDRLLSDNLLSAEQAEAIDTDEVGAFFQTPRGASLLTARGLRREQKFSLLVQNGDIPGLTLPEGEKVLLQGVIDCFYETPDGMVLLDFKTDRVRRGGEEERAERYRPQMEAYAAALAAMTGKPVYERVLFFLTTGREVAV
ncbi:MAG: UvrD-helicase domain-containing protein [Oscillospiraceae bacterium]|jgi:ATP-dependent helicase/nuclease subunit A|nr:UvrD-helicase domain-containing protein [Oscillospiraceae bacterium]